MIVIRSEKRLCSCCMSEHEVKTVIEHEKLTFKETKVEYDATYLYCDIAEEYYMDEEMIQDNDIKLKEAYRSQKGLLTSKDIVAIRNKYSISQNDLCILLGWGGKTIARYESHQVQDKAHDSILKKLDTDPEWFIELLTNSKGNLSRERIKKYYLKARELYERENDVYLRKSIVANYVKYSGKNEFNGNTELSLDKVVDVIRYYAASNEITGLYKVKLMKLMWYADALSYKLRQHSITGLVYQALPMGAVPVGHNLIIDLKNVPCEEVDLGETTAYHFVLHDEDQYLTLTDEDKAILDTVIVQLGKMSKNEIVEFMHNEKAYIQTAPRDVISYSHALELQI